ncbi:MAG: hypothetical protein QNJ89_11915 [Acidimicrobiia bacterium]|nr:hypothetical protein [Acidimicrobiia bacterium]
MNRGPICCTVMALALLLASCSSADPGVTSTLPELTTLADLPVATTVATPELPPPPPPGLCEAFDAPVAAGTIRLAEAIEISGIAPSRTHPGIIWMHNDSGGGPIVFAFDESGAHQGTFELDVLAFDWEDMAIGPGPDPGRDYLYLGDIGDNLHFRPAITVYRIAEPEPDPAGRLINDVAILNLRYPEPGPDAEALLVDPLTGDIIVVTKGASGEPSVIYRAPASQLADGTVTNLIEVGRFDLEPGTFVTAADISGDGSAIVFRGYNEVWLWSRLDIEFLRTFAEEPCRAPSTAEVQGEAIAFAPDSYSYFTVSEGPEPDINYVANSSS